MSDGQFLQQVLQGLALGSAYATVALGFAVTFSVMGVINLAHPGLVALGAYAAVVAYPRTGVVGSVLLAIGVTAVMGLIIERGIIRPTNSKGLLPPFIATAGLGIALEYGLQRYFGVDARNVPTPWNTTIHIFSAQIQSTELMMIILAVLMTGGLAFYVRGTKWGMATRAVAERATTAGALGINVPRVSQLAVVLSSGMGGLAGVALGFMLGQASPFMGATYGTSAFVCMLVAGNRRPEGILVIGLALGLIETWIVAYVSAALRDAFTFAILAVVLFFRPDGLFGSYQHH